MWDTRRICAALVADVALARLWTIRSKHLPGYTVKSLDWSESYYAPPAKPFYKTMLSRGDKIPDDFERISSEDLILTPDATEAEFLTAAASSHPRG